MKAKVTGTKRPNP